MDLPPENWLTAGGFNSHSTCWGYEETDRRGEEVEDWQVESSLLLLNDPEDPPIFYSRRWKTTSTPDFAFAFDDLSKKTTRKVLTQFDGSNQRSIKLTINLQYRPQNSKTFPRWKYKGRSTQDSLTPTPKKWKRRIRTSTDLPTVSLKQSWSLLLLQFHVAPERITDHTGQKNFRGFKRKLKKHIRWLKQVPLLKTM